MNGDIRLTARENSDDWIIYEIQKLFLNTVSKTGGCNIITFKEFFCINKDVFEQFYGFDKFCEIVHSNPSAVLSQRNGSNLSKFKVCTTHYSDTLTTKHLEFRLDGLPANDFYNFISFLEDNYKYHCEVDYKYVDVVNGYFYNTYPSKNRARYYVAKTTTMYRIFEEESDLKEFLFTAGEIPCIPDSLLATQVLVSEYGNPNWQVGKFKRFMDEDFGSASSNINIEIKKK